MHSIYHLKMNPEHLVSDKLMASIKSRIIYLTTLPLSHKVSKNFSWDKNCCRKLECLDMEDRLCRGIHEHLYRGWAQFANFFCAPHFKTPLLNG